jgi:hypothetical protein
MELEDLCVRLETMQSSISENQFMVHILNNLTSDYELQLAMMERRVGGSERPLNVEEIRGEFSLRFERLNISKAEEEGWRNMPCLEDSSKESVEIVDSLATSRFNARIAQSTMVEITVIQAVVEFFVCIVASQDIRRRIVSS